VGESSNGYCVLAFRRNMRMEGRLFRQREHCHQQNQDQKKAPNVNSNGRCVFYFAYQQ
jgi:hypothetical protein